MKTTINKYRRINIAIKVKGPGKTLEGTCTRASLNSLKMTNDVVSLSGFLVTARYILTAINAG